MNFKRFSPKKNGFCFIFLFFVSASAFCQTSWKGTTSTNWSTVSNWTNGVPTATMDATLGDANFTGLYQPTFSATSYCNNLVIGGTVNTTLTVNKTFTASGNITINSGGTISHTASTFSVKGNWTNNGNYTGTVSTVLVTFIGTGKSINGTSITNFQKLTINSSSIITTNVNITVANILTVSGTFIPAENATPVVISGIGALTVGVSGVLKVNAATYAGNYTLSGTLTLSGGSTIEYSATLINQTINQAITYSTLKVSGALVKTPGGNLPAFVSTTNTTGNITVSSGILDLSTFTADRGTTVAGGTITVSNGATLRIGGTNTLPANYTKTAVLGVSGTVEYYGNNQTIAAKTYGNLILSGTTGAVVKTIAATTFTVAGNFTTSVGAASSLSFTAAAVITFTGDILIGASTTFYGGSFTHIAKGNWVNNGTVEGNTSTFSCQGIGKSFSGTGAYNFYNLTITGAGNTAPATTNITVSGSFVTTGSGAFTHAAGGTVTMSGTTKPITGTGIVFSNLSCTGTITTYSNFTVSGNLAVTGSLNATAGTITLNGSSKTISGTGTIFLMGLSVSGTISTTSDLKISTSLNVSGTFTTSSPSTVTFASTSTLNGTANLFNVTINGTSLQLSTSAVLGIANTFTISAGTLNVTSTIPNTVNYNGAAAQTVKNTTYNNLTFSNGNTKTAAGAITANGDVTIASSTTFNASTYSHTINGNWINNGSFTQGTSSISFNGAADATISGVNVFNILTVNKSSSTNKVILLNNITVPTVNLTNGILTTGTNTIIITTTRTGPGIILGNIQRTHAFTTGVAYAFEGPDNIITFTSVTGVTTITVKVTIGSIIDFPYGTSVNRAYDIVIPSGTYSSTLRLHYQDAELNGNTETSMQTWHYNGTAWIVTGKASNSTTSNYVEQTGLTNITNRWTLSDVLNVARWNGSVSTDWFTAANWTSINGTPSLPPASTDIVELGTAVFTNQPSINNAATVKGISFGSAQTVSLNLVTNGSLTNQGNISGIWSANASHSINANNQTINVNGDVTLSDGTAGHAINLNMAAGITNITGSLTQTGGSNITFTGSATLNITKDFNYVSGTFTAGTGTVVFNGITSQIIAGVTYNDLTINKSAGIGSINSAATIRGNLLISAGELDINAASSISGNMTLASGAILNNSSVSVSVAGNWNNNGNYVSSNGSITFIGSGSQSITPTTFNNLTINKPSGTATLTGNLAINGDLSITSGALDLAAYTSNRSSAGGTLTISDGATISLAGANNFPSNYSLFSLGNASTVIFNGSVVQTMPGMTYGNLTLSNGGTNAKILAASATINGNININTGATFDAGSYTNNVGGNWINNGTFTGGTSTTVMTGTSKSISGIGTTFNKLTISGSYTSTCDLTYSEIMVITSTGSLDLGTTTSVVNNDLTNSGILSSNGIITFSGTRVQNLQFDNGINTGVNSIVNFNGTVAPLLTSTGPLTFSTVNINNTASVSPSVNWTSTVAFNINSGATFAGNSGTHTFTGSFTNNGVVTSAGTLNFSPSASQTITLAGTGFSNSGSVIFGGSGAITTTGTPTSLNDVTISNTAGVTAGSDWIIGNNFTIASGAIFNAGSYNFTVAGDVQSNGTLNGGTSTFTLSAASGVVSGTPTTTFYHLIITGTQISVATGFNIAGNLTTNGTLDASGGTVTFTGNTNAVIGGSTTRLEQFKIAKGTGAFVTLARNVTLVTAIDIVSGTLDAATYSIVQDATVGAINSLFIRNTAKLKIAGSNPLPAFTFYALDSLSTVEYAGTTQTITSISALSPYGNLIISTAGTKTANGSLNIRNNFTLTTGTFVSGNYSDTLGGNWNMTSGALTSTGTTLNLNGSRAEYLNSNGAFNNLTVNKTTGIATLAANATVNGVLRFTLGNIQTGSYIVIITAGGSVTGSGQSTGWVNGKLKKYYATGSNISTSFDIGGSAYYTPATIAFSSVTTAGNLVANVTSTDHPNLSSSGINGNKSVNRYFTFSNSGIVFTTATITFNWVATDIDAGAATANFKVQSYNGASWNSLSTVSPLPTSIQATGVSAFGDFAIGEPFPTSNWTGATSTDWNTGSNWSAGIPTSATDVTIPSGLSNYPIINTGTSAVRDVTIQAGAALTLSAATLQVSGVISNSGTFTANTGTIEMNGTSAQTIAANTFTSNTIKNIISTNSAGVSLGGTLNITNTISFGNINNSTITAGGFLTLVSNAAGTAMVRDITNGGANTGNNISGNVTVQQFISSRRAYRFLTPQVNTTGTIRANWMENTNNPSTSVNNNPVPNYGTHITGYMGNINGFDASNTNNASLFTYDNQNQLWTAVTNTGSTLQAGSAYDILIRGSRSTDLNNNLSPSSVTTLRATGSLLTGTIIMAKQGAGGTAGMPSLSSAINGYSFIGNPYASAIDWILLEKTDLAGSIYIFDPTLSGSNGRGAYVSYNASTGISNASSHIDNNLQPGQSFFIQTNGPNPSLAIKEIHKSIQQRFVFRTQKLPNISLLLLLPKQDNEGETADGLAAYFSSAFDSSLGDEDSYKFSNLDENIAIRRNGKNLSIEGRKPVKETDTLPLIMWQMSQKKYAFKIAVTSIPENINTCLEDNYLHLSTILKNNASTIVPFTITSDSLSFATDRFKIVFKRHLIYSNPTNSIKAYEKNDGVEVGWTTEFENNVSSFEVEKSVDGVHFIVVGLVKAKENSASLAAYSWLDKNPVDEENFYRVKVINKSGDTVYTQIAKIKVVNYKSSISVFPNPVQGNTINLLLKNITKGNYRIRLISSEGKAIYAENFSYTGGSGLKVIKLNELISKGNYQVQLISDESFKNISILVQ